MNDRRPARYRGVLFLGPPGSGKGTQSQAIARLPGYYLFGTGELFRRLDPDTELGNRVREYLIRGDLVPDHLVLQLWQSHIEQAIQHGDLAAEHDILLMDACPRDVEQAELFDQHIEFLLVIHLRVDDDELLKSRLRQRAARPDDRDSSVIDHRFDVYHRRTAPLLDYFSHVPIATVDAAEPPLVVLQNVARNLAALEVS